MKSMVASVSMLLVAIAIVIVVSFSLVNVVNHGNLTTKKKETNTVVLPSSIAGFLKVSNNVTSPNSKTWVLYVGSEACPFCTAESWSIYYSLEERGIWMNVTQEYSNSSDIYSSTPGLSFYGATYSSSSIDFTGFEISNTNWQPLQKLNLTDSVLFKDYDFSEKIPFILVDGIFMQVGSATSPKLLQNQTAQDVMNDLKNNVINNFSKSIIREAHNITEVINEINNYTQVNEAISSYSQFLSGCFQSSSTVLSESRSLAHSD